MTNRGPHWTVPLGFLALMVGMIALTVLRFVRPASEGLPAVRSVPPFRFVDQSGAPFGSADMFAPQAAAPRIWIADFIFTNCAGPCPLMTLGMAELQRRLQDTPEVGFVSFSVDPDRDTPEVLARYAREYGAAPGWRFLTGPRDDIHRLCNEGFMLTVARERLDNGADPAAALPPPATRPTTDDQGILHSTLFVLLDAGGRIRGFFEGDKPDSHEALARAARVLARDLRVPPALAGLPAVNATLNAVSIIFLMTGYAAIRMRRKETHRVLMLSAVITSALFLVSYVVYHAYARSTPFAGVGAVRTVYYVILLTHVVLAAAIAVLVPIVLVRAVRGDFARHRRLARIVFPIWLYVALTGVAIYLALYQVYPAAGTRL